MRTYGRVKNPDGTYQPWQVITTPANGDNSLIWLITFCQVLKLFLNESPFWGNYGIPAKVTIMTQVFPGYYVSQAQLQFSPYFASLIVYQQNNPSPEYVINITTLAGERIGITMDAPQ